MHIKQNNQLRSTAELPVSQFKELSIDIARSLATYGKSQLASLLETICG